MDTWQKSMPCTGGQTQGAWVAPALVPLGAGVILYNGQEDSTGCGEHPQIRWGEPVSNLGRLIPSV